MTAVIVSLVAVCTVGLCDSCNRAMNVRSTKCDEKGSTVQQVVG